MSNAHRGEVSVVLDGREYTLRPSWAAYVAIEAALAPKTILQLIADYQTRGLSATETAVIITEGIRAWALENDDKMMARYQVHKVGEMIFDSGGVDAVIPACLEFMLNLNGGSKKKAVKKPKEASTTAA